MGANGLNEWLSSYQFLPYVASLAMQLVHHSEDHEDNRHERKDTNNCDQGIVCTEFTSIEGRATAN